MMADSGSLRVRRHRAHKMGDHSLCRNCAAIREQRRLVVPDIDPVAELRATAARLAAVHRDDPANIAAAHELRLTLAELARMTPSLADPLDELVGMLSAS
jgi:hypothetical protein